MMQINTLQAGVSRRCPVYKQILDRTYLDAGSDGRVVCIPARASLDSLPEQPVSRGKNYPTRRSDDLLADNY